MSVNPLATNPLAITPDVHLVRGDGPPAGDGRRSASSLVLTGAEPVLVDTGSAEDRDSWWRQVELLVDPARVRWVFLTHDDPDHAGNLAEVLRRCPAATLVGSELLRHRLPVPAGDRVRLVRDGERFDLGPRPVVAVRPPVYDSPATLGLFDVGSGTYWSADCFGTPVPHPVDEVGDLDRDVWEAGFRDHHLATSPWLVDVEPVRWCAAIGRMARLDPITIVGAHGPVVHRRDVRRALDLLADLPSSVRPVDLLVG